MFLGRGGLRRHRSVAPRQEKKKDMLLRANGALASNPTAAKQRSARQCEIPLGVAEEDPNTAHNYSLPALVQQHTHCTMRTLRTVAPNGNARIIYVCIGSV